MIKYKTLMGQIHQLEIDRETAKQVVIKGRRENKRSDYQNWFDSFEDAKQHLVDRAQKRVNDADGMLRQAKGQLAMVYALKPFDQQ